MRPGSRAFVASDSKESSVDETWRVERVVEERHVYKCMRQYLGGRVQIAIVYKCTPIKKIHRNLNSVVGCMQSP